MTRAGEESPFHAAEDLLQRAGEWGALAVEAIGVVVLVAGALFGVGVYLWKRVRDRPGATAYRDARLAVGRALLLGLELLVAAEIVRTVLVEPTLTNVGVLGLIVLIRVFLSFALEIELHNRWPWEPERDRTKG